MQCFLCHKPISGRYINAMDHEWHPECFVCAACQKPFDGSFQVHEGKPYHAACFHERFSPRCAIGGEPIRAAYLQNDWGDVYCPDHAKDCPVCFSCHRPICQRLTRGGVAYPDGRAMCNQCRKTAIDQPERGAAAVALVRRTLAKHGIDLKDVHVPIRLVLQPELDALNSKRKGAKTCGMMRSRIFTEDKRVVKRVVEEILVLRGLPEDHFASIMAHELGHAWLFLNEYPPLPDAVEEGVCELCNALWLRSLAATPSALRRLKIMAASDDAVYGRGFRAADKALQRLPLSTLLAFVRHQRRFP